MVFSTVFKQGLAVLTIATGLLFASPAMSFSNTFSDLFFDVEAQKESGKNRAAAKAKAKHGGKVLNVTKTTKGGRTAYKVKLLQESGRIKIVTITE